METRAADGLFERFGIHPDVGLNQRHLVFQIHSGIRNALDRFQGIRRRSTGGLPTGPLRDTHTRWP